MTQVEKDTKAGRLLSSRSAWNRARIGPGVVGIVISGLDPTQLKLLSVFKEVRSLNSFAMQKYVLVVSSKNPGAGEMGC